MKAAAVNIEDDDVVVVEGPPVAINENSNETSETPITVTVEDGIQSDDECAEVEIDHTNQEPKPSERFMDKFKEKSFVRLLRNNTLLNKIVQRCLNMESNCGMTRVIHKTLLPLYKDVNNTLKESDTLTEAFKSILHRLKHDPNHKFLHIKTLCDGLKAGKFGRKVPFITLATDIKKTSKKHTKRKTKKRIYNTRESNAKLVEKHCKYSDVIDLDQSDEPVTLELTDDSDREDIMIVENDDNDDDTEKSNEENSVIHTNNKIESNIQEEIDNSIATNKENSRLEELIVNETERNENNRDIVTKTVDSGVQNEHFIEIDTSNIINMRQIDKNKIEPDKNQLDINLADCNSDYNLLIPHNSVSYTKFSRPYKKILEIENKIQEYKEKIQELEEAEVTNNSHTSPYILCNKYKADVVALYKKLCQLTGNGDGNLMKQRVVRLHAVEGHPQEPVKMLETFLNSTIDNTGAVPLPDLDDVINCVNQANLVYNLGWSTHDITKEAFALFTHCGRALRKQRQKREYKDLLSLVQDKDIDEYDPANKDPELQRRLEENMKIAKANEDEILERYVQMENLSKKSMPIIPPLQSDIIPPNNYSGSESDSDVDSTPQNNSSLKKMYFPILYVNRNRGESSKQNLYTPMTYTNNLHNNETNLTMQNNIISIPQNTITTQHSITNKDALIVYTDLNKLQKIGSSNRYVIAYNSNNQDLEKNNNLESGNIDAETPNPEVNIKLENENEIEAGARAINILFEDDIKEPEKQTESISNANQDTVKVTLENAIKKEPVDIQSLLDSLGDNYVSTIFDIEDPFVVVEISDSSDEES